LRIRPKLDEDGAVRSYKKLKRVEEIVSLVFMIVKISGIREIPLLIQDSQNSAKIGKAEPPIWKIPLF